MNLAIRWLLSGCSDQPLESQLRTNDITVHPIANHRLMAEERERIARWTEPTSIQGTDLAPEEDVPRGAPSARGSNTTPWAIERRWSNWEFCQPMATPVRSLLTSRSPV